MQVNLGFRDGFYLAAIEVVRLGVCLVALVDLEPCLAGHVKNPTQLSGHANDGILLGAEEQGLLLVVDAGAVRGGLRVPSLALLAPEPASQINAAQKGPNKTMKNISFGNYGDYGLEGRNTQLVQLILRVQFQ